MMRSINPHNGPEQKEIIMETKTTSAAGICNVLNIKNFTPITVSANFRALEYFKYLEKNR
jgi:hypothetical protein